jgi:hypothetical protein
MGRHGSGGERYLLGGGMDADLLFMYSRTAAWLIMGTVREMGWM